MLKQIYAKIRFISAAVIAPSAYFYPPTLCKSTFCLFSVLKSSTGYSDYKKYYITYEQ